MSLKIPLFMSAKKRAILFSLFAGISTVVVVWILLTSLVSVGQDNSLDNIRIVIDTKALTLQVLEGDREMLVFTEIAIGRYGTSLNRRKGDNKTPLGHFNIAWITDNTSFHRFFGFSYPSKEYAERAFQAGHLDQKTWDKIRQALASGRLPPQNTILGGSLGIHGIGQGDIEVHKQYNWTNGCIALTNDQIDILTDWIRIGTPVEIR
jgi:murein L,D-transpeptidase YafK